jgi:hypothetical protein
MDNQYLRPQETGQIISKKKLALAIIIVFVFGLAYKYRYELQTQYEKLVPMIKTLKNRI